MATARIASRRGWLAHLIRSFTLFGPLKGSGDTGHELDEAEVAAANLSVNARWVRYKQGTCPIPASGAALSSVVK